MAVLSPFVCLYTGPGDECWNCGGWTRAAGGPFPGDSRFCTEDCCADFSERARQRDPRMACCPGCGFDNQEHSEECTRPEGPVPP
jgi:hypothetical protein